MRSMGLAILAALCTASALAATTIDDAALKDEADGRNWAAYGRTFSEGHYSPLSEINRETVSRLNLAWTLDLDVTNNLSTPLAVDGVIYVASGYSFVHAVDVKTGKLLWRYDPEVAKAAGAKLRTGWGIRGLSYLEGPAVRRHPRRAPDFHRCENRQAGVERADHRHQRRLVRVRPAARVQRQGDHRFRRW